MISQRPQKQMLIQDAFRLLAVGVLGWVCIRFSPDLAIWGNESALSAWGLIIGGTFWIIGFSHIARRILFPNTDLLELFKRAKQTSTGAAIIALGIMYVLGQIIVVMGAGIQLR